MFDWQFTLYRTYAETMQSYTNAYFDTLTSAMPGSSNDTPAEPVSDGARARALVTMPEIPSRTRSWYRPPIQNPVLEFWDDVLRPWRTFMPAPDAPRLPFPGMPGNAFASAFTPQTAASPFAMLTAAEQTRTAVQTAWATWADAMGSFTPVMDADASSSADRTARNPVSDDQTAGCDFDSVVAFQTASGMAIARLFFPTPK